MPELPKTKESEVPRWIMLACTGRWLGHPAAEEIIVPAHLRAARDYFEEHYVGTSTDVVIDYNHASVSAASEGKPAPAAGWITGMELRADDTQLWGSVLWTSQAASSVARREYRYISPVLRFNTPDRLSGEPVPMHIHSVALTNTPFLTELEALNESSATALTPREEGETMSLKKSLVAQLGLPDDADDAAVLKAVDELQDACTLNEAVQLVNSAVAEGRVPPAHREFYLNQARADLPGAREVINSLPVLTAAESRPSARIAAPAVLTETERSICAQLAITQEAFAQARS
jgi:phage I-like protein